MHSAVATARAPMEHERTPIILGVPESVDVRVMNKIRDALEMHNASVVAFRTSDGFTIKEFAASCADRELLVLVLDGSHYEPQMLAAAHAAGVRNVAFICTNSIGSYHALRPKTSGMRIKLVAAKSPQDQSKVGNETGHTLVAEHLEYSCPDIARALLGTIMIRGGALGLR